MAFAKKPAVAEEPLKGVWDDSWVKNGSLVWCEMPVKETNADAFLPAVVKSYDSGTKKAEVEYENKKGPSPVRIDKFMERAEKYIYLDDLVDIECLNDAELLFNLYKKFMEKKIFTYCGPTLLITNPYEGVAHFFTKEVLLEYKTCALGDSFSLKDKPPHVWAISALTYWQLFANAKKQAVCISGESGAGKTVNTKLAMQFMTSMSSSGDEKPGEERIEDKILGCNPILEAFGNAKTVRNDNSSRFGKYVALICKIGKGKTDSKIIGAATTNYLLEKSRIVQQAETERNYHIFYQCMYGLPAETLKKYNFENNPEKYDILRLSKKFTVPTIDDVAEFKGVTDSFVKMKFSEEEVDIVYSVVGGVLNIGNIQFNDEEYDGSKFVKIEEGNNYLNLACEVLGLDKERTAKALTRVMYSALGKTSEKAINKGSCESLKGSLAKDLFEKLFNWLVKRLNVTILPEEDKIAGGIGANKKERYTIGLLDIFGFEIFKENSIEQFCINFTNENLHQLYIEYVFKAEEVTFRSEGLGDAIGKELSFEDNQHIIDLLSKGKESVISLMNESTRVAGVDPRKNDLMFYGNIKKFCVNHPNFKIPRLKADSFTIVHTAKEVDYSINNFIAKNQDSLSPLLVDCIMNSSKKQLVRVFKNILADNETQEDESDSPDDKNKKYLAYKFNQQMYDLMAELKTCECNFIRCIKPNEEKKKEVWDPALTVGQIRYLGILDSIKIRKSSYPYRKEFKQFYKRYIDLDPAGSRIPFKRHEDNPETDWKALCKAVHKSAIPEYGDSQILFGKTKVFVRIECNMALEKIYVEKLKKKKESVLTVAEYLKFYKRKQMFFKVTMDTIKLTKILHDLVISWKSKILYRNFRRLKNITVRIQRNFRFVKYLHAFAKKRHAAKIIKGALECQGRVASRKKQQEAARKINKVWKGALARKLKRSMLMFKLMVFDIFEVAWKKVEFKIHSKAAVKIQTIIRGCLARARNRPAIEQIKKARAEFLANAAATFIQAFFRGKIGRKRYLSILNATKTIQGFWAMKRMSISFKRMRKAVLKIQKAANRYLIRKRVISFRFKKYLEEEGDVFFDFQKLEYKCLIEFAGGLNEKTKQSIRAKYGGNTGFSLSSIPDQSSLAPNKFNLWMFILDIEFSTDLSDVYDPLWTQQLKELLNETRKGSSDIQMLEVGSTHTISLSNTNKMHSWGLNDYGQLGRNSPMNDDPLTFGASILPKKNNNSTRVKNFACGEEHTMFVDKDGDLYVAGRNDKGQLGIQSSSNKGNFVPHHILNKVDVIDSVVSKGIQSVVLGESGNAYYFPTKISPLESVNEPVRLGFPEDVKIIGASCGFDFVMFLSSKGMLYSMGRNSYGELGHGSFKEEKTPRMIEFFFNEKQKIASVSCGFRHTVSRANNGRIYTWGDGAKGQLGHGNSKSISSPRLVQAGGKSGMSKALQVRASKFCSTALMEDFEMFWWGSNGSIKNEVAPTKIKVNWSSGLFMDESWFLCGTS